MGDAAVAVHRAGRAEARIGEGVDIGVQRHAVLQPQADRAGERVHQPAHRRGFARGRDGQLAQAAVLELAGLQEHAVAVDRRLLGEAATPRRQLASGRAGGGDRRLMLRQRRHVVEEAGQGTMHRQPRVAAGARQHAVAGQAERQRRFRGQAAPGQARQGARGQPPVRTQRREDRRQAAALHAEQGVDRTRLREAGLDPQARRRRLAHHRRQRGQPRHRAARRRPHQRQLRAVGIAAQQPGSGGGEAARHVAARLVVVVEPEPGQAGVEVAQQQARRRRTGPGRQEPQRVRHRVQRGLVGLGLEAAARLHEGGQVEHEPRRRVFRSGAGPGVRSGRRASQQEQHRERPPEPVLRAGQPRQPVDPAVGGVGQRGAAVARDQRRQRLRRPVLPVGRQGDAARGRVRIGGLVRDAHPDPVPAPPAARLGAHRRVGEGCGIRRA